MLRSGRKQGVSHIEPCCWLAVTLPLTDAMSPLLLNIGEDWFATVNLVSDLIAGGRQTKSGKSGQSKFNFETGSAETGVQECDSTRDH